MEISRYGATANHGKSTVTFKAPKISWNEITKTIVIQKTGVKDFSTTSRHNYTVSISLDEMAQILQAAATARTKNSELFVDLPPQTLKSLLLIQAAIVGI